MKRRYYIAIGGYCAFLFWMSHQSRLPETEFNFDGSDKVAHFIVYGVLAAIVSVGLHRAPVPYSANVRLSVPVLFALFYGVSDEVHQAFVPGRTFSYLDMVADGLGGLVAQLVCLYVFKKVPQALPAEEQGTQ